MIGIIDYGAGNLRSVKKALDYLGVESRVMAGPEGMEGIHKLVLPGVGAFGAAVERLRQQGLWEPLTDWLGADRPFLGICLGMQVLFETSEEAPGVRGLEVFPGTVRRFQTHKVPQIGWNQVHRRRPVDLMEGIPEGAFFYFLHGYYVEPVEAELIAAETEYGVVYPSVIRRGNICAVQFHPEKSAEAGLTLLRNWVT
ncbi:MAG: imidazole glycerol phosphate synthase subunit HisH [Calditrichaeota bacterium]|nr:MAG: imidazole glycerol phosphate synthase subunit HisH [Calditrichota bacterium]